LSEASLSAAFALHNLRVNNRKIINGRVYYAAGIRGLNEKIFELEREFYLLL